MEIEFEKINYKNLDIFIQSDLKTIEVLVQDNNLNNTESYISFITLIVEYTEKFEPDFVIINKLHSNFILNKVMFTYTKEFVFNQLKSFGTKGVIMLVKEEYYQKFYANINLDPFLYVFRNRENAYNWVKKNLDYIRYSQKNN